MFLHLYDYDWLDRANHSFNQINVATFIREWLPKSAFLTSSSRKTLKWNSPDQDNRDIVFVTRCCALHLCWWWISVLLISRPSTNENLVSQVFFFGSSNVSDVLSVLSLFHLKILVKIQGLKSIVHTRTARTKRESRKATPSLSPLLYVHYYRYRYVGTSAVFREEF